MRSDASLPSLPMFNLADTYAHLEAIEQKQDLLDDAHFAQRADVLDALEMQLDALAAQTAADPRDEQIQAVYVRACASRDTLVAANEDLFRRFRKHTAAGHVEPHKLLAELRRCAPPSALHNDLHYDSLDVLIHGVVRADDAPAEPASLPAEMVAYQPTPMRFVLEMIERTDLGPADVFFDLGSGLGHVAIVVALLSGARAVGIEIDPGLCGYAQRCAALLNLDRVEFRNEDARAASFRDGTLFYLYTPFHGAILETVLQRLRREAEQRAIRVCTYGPCTAAVAQQSWLTQTHQDLFPNSPLTLFRSNLH